MRASELGALGERRLDLCVRGRQFGGAAVAVARQNIILHAPPRMAGARMALEKCRGELHAPLGVGERVNVRVRGAQGGMRARAIAVQNVIVWL